MKKQLTINLDITIPNRYDIKMLEADLGNLKDEIAYFFREDSYIDLRLSSISIEIADIPEILEVVRFFDTKIDEDLADAWAV